MRNSILPVTKVGSGEKERAYVVRQNLCLKILLAVVIALGALGSALIFTQYEVSVQRKHKLAGARVHREEEHSSHMRIMRLSMLLQRHLEDDVRDANLLTTYRAWLMRAIGDYQQGVADTVKEAKCTVPSPVERVDDAKKLRTSLLERGTTFDREVENVLKVCEPRQGTHPPRRRT